MFEALRSGRYYGWGRDGVGVDSITVGGREDVTIIPAALSILRASHLTPPPPHPPAQIDNRLGTSSEAEVEVLARAIPPKQKSRNWRPPEKALKIRSAPNNRNCKYRGACTGHGLHTYIHTYIHTYMHACMHTYIRTYVRTYIRTYVHLYMHTSYHTSVHT